jgi:acyl-CoA synthetase (AMP-forming)/AMP-acid ligase II
MLAFLEHLQMTVPETLSTVMARGEATAPAIGAPGRTPLTHAGLRGLAERTVASLNTLGIGRGDRVAIVLPNGPEMATAFLTIGCGATTAPLNPAYRTDEFDFYLSDLNARALVILEGMESPSREVAAAKHIPIISLVPDSDGPAGTFTLRSESPDASSAPAAPGLAGTDDVVLVLHTSGTTARPKIVPLRHRNVAASARNIGRVLQLTPNDVCMNIMPLFHIHGLIAATLSSIAAGGCVNCTPGFNALHFFRWFDEVRPTWYTAVPTMHQAILARADRHPESLKVSRLRFIRSSSASLPPQVMQALETTFGVPVIEAYGMTEAAHQMASNPLPPEQRFAGSVGVAAGPDIAIMDETGEVLPSGALGEVVIRGANVTSGYENNPTANASAFTNGWFRTGDQGTLDAQGYLRLTGRIKELINRGGEKISPLEVDEVLMDHPSVAQAVTFAMPHDMLGEEVAAAVVLREGAAEPSEREIRDFVAERLANFKVPRQVVFLTEVPKGPTGKVQRIGLAKLLGVGE